MAVLNWIEAPEYHTSPDNWSYYLNAAYDYEGYRFIINDYTSRNAAPFNYYGVNGEADVHTYSTNWLAAQIDTAQKYKQKMIILAHHPLLNKSYAWWGPCFTAHEIHQISDAGLLNNHPVAIWIGGHVHGDSSIQKIDTTFYNDDTVAFVYTLRNACKDGIYGYVEVYDSVYAYIRVLPYSSTYGPILVHPVEIVFDGYYGYIGSGNAPSYYFWDFGDGSTITTQSSSPQRHIYHLYNTLDTVFKVNFIVTTVGGRKVYYTKLIKVTASPYNLHTEFIKEDSVKLVWSFDQPDKVEYYIVKRNDQDIAHPTTKEFIDTQNTGLQRGQTYNYAVSVHYKSWVGHDDSPPVQLFNVQVPWMNAPTNLAVIGQPAPNQVKLQWTDNSQVEAGFKIARKVDGGQWNENYKTVGANTTQFTDTVSFLHKYTYKVRAYDNAGHYSAWSNTVNFSSGMLAQSSYPKMSAFNNGAKV